MTDYRKAFENAKNRINFKENMAKLEELVKAEEILEANSFWVVLDGQNGKHFVFRSKLLATVSTTSLVNDGANLIIDIGGAKRGADDAFPLDRLFLTESEAEIKADELNKESKK